ncbi:Endonuclease/Exonuclease/phosphatase family protein [uncultured archaeon]|nr:Endonuclease/Exonuclease/phosphatase family protein [uncultured archaeon]
MKSYLKVMSLNLYHGRGICPPYLFKPIVSRKKVRDNLREVSDMINHEGPDVILMQEAERYSILSGRFDHLSELSEISGYPYFSGEDAKIDPENNFFLYGTAIISKYPVKNSLSYNFFDTIPFRGKGFTKGTINIPEFHKHPIDFVSAHFVALHLFPKRARQKNAYSLVRTIHEETRKMPLIVGGDFNSEWNGEKLLDKICTGLNINAYNPLEKGLETFPSRKPRKRIDWVFASPKLEFKDYYVLDRKVSDHLGVMAVLEEKK